MHKARYAVCILLTAVLLWLSAIQCAAQTDGIYNTNTEYSSNATQVDLAIAYARSQLGSRKYNSFCQRFVRVCFEAAGIEQTVGVASAKEACSLWRVSSSRENIPVGAVLYFDTGVYGHSAIYLGNNRMIHALSRVVEQEISDSFWDLYMGWGWQAGQVPDGTYINQEDVLTGDVYRTDERIRLYDSPYGGSTLSTVSEGNAISVTSTVTVDGELWGKTKYYSDSGYVKLKYCTYMYTAGGASETKALESEGIIAAVISNTPDKYYYIKGEAIDAAGLEIKLIYGDGSSYTVDSGYEVVTSKAVGSGRETVLIKYRDALLWYYVVVSDTGDELDAFRLRKKDADKDTELGCLVIYEDIKVTRIGSLLKNASKMAVYSANGESKHSGYLATGDYIVYHGAELAAVTVVRYGDLSGDGRISLADELCKRRYNEGFYSLDSRIAALVMEAASVVVPSVPSHNIPIDTFITPY